MLNSKFFFSAIQFQILNINFFAYNEIDAIGLMNSIKILFPDNHIYVSQEKMRYYIRGIVVCNYSELLRSYSQILQMINYYNCCCDDFFELNYKKAG